jgi:ppGpp synthetase/RelA/SpoT-type nucleotidyltranferase
MDHASDGEWWLAEPPKAYTWDPDAVEFFKKLGLETHLKPTRYTSVHYLVRPREGGLACCEIQVRTLWEEIWGEVDHALNYPTSSENVACVEQIRVLARLVATGTRLADAIFVCHRDQTAPNSGLQRTGDGPPLKP